MLKEYDMKRDSVEANHKTPQWSHNAVWNRRYMEPKTGYTLRQLWADSEPAIGQKSSPSYEVKDGDISRAVAENSNPSWFKNPFYVNPRTYTQMQFLQLTHSEVYANAVPTHKLSGSEQLNPFWTLSQRCGSKNTNQSKTNKQDGLNHVTVSDYFFAVSLALSQKQPYSLTATIV